MVQRLEDLSDHDAGVIQVLEDELGDLYDRNEDFLSGAQVSATECSDAQMFGGRLDRAGAEFVTAVMERTRFEDPEAALGYLTDNLAGHQEFSLAMLLYGRTPAAVLEDLLVDGVIPITHARELHREYIGGRVEGAPPALETLQAYVRDNVDVARERPSEFIETALVTLRALAVESGREFEPLAEQARDIHAAEARRAFDALVERAQERQAQADDSPTP
jgi:hypothetical protein